MIWAYQRNFNSWLVLTLLPSLLYNPDRKEQNVYVVIHNTLKLCASIEYLYLKISFSLCPYHADDGSSLAKFIAIYFKAKIEMYLSEWNQLYILFSTIHQDEFKLLGIQFVHVLHVFYCHRLKIAGWRLKEFCNHKLRKTTKNCYQRDM